MANKGFTLIELLVVITLVGLLLTFTLMPTQRVTATTSLEQVLNKLITDLRAQQSYAMLGFNQSVGSPDNYSIYFQTNSYTTFKGTTYSSNHGSNNINTYPTQVTMTTNTLPSQTITFIRLTGYVAGWTNTTNSVTLKSSNQQKSLVINQLGSITTQ